MSLVPPLAGPCTRDSQSDPQANIITLNVGGEIFQTSPQTLDLAGPGSFLTTLACSKGASIPFIDRDPELFSILLYFLRTGALPSKAKAFDPDDIISEAQFYNLVHLLNRPITNSSEFDAFELEKALILPLNGRDYPSAIAPFFDGSILVSHGSKITSFNWSLRKKTTVLTEFSAIDSLLALSPDIAAAGATDFSGLQIIDSKLGSVLETLSWENQTHSGSNVQAIGSSPELLFVSFESERRNSNSIVVFDRSSFQPVTEIGKQEIYGVDLLGSSIPCTKLNWSAGFNLLLSSGLHRGPSGFVSSIKLWDIRDNKAVWELHEKGDCFADLTVCDNVYGIFKVGVMSGDVFMADLRKLGVDGPWVSLGGPMRKDGKREGVHCKLVSHGSHVFCSRGGDVELWSEVLMAHTNQGRIEERVFRRNTLGAADNKEESMITHLDFGGNRMILARKDEQMIEIWQSPAANLF
ncbi:BTB/POZ domain-containing protein At5g41330 [Nymphaea colorata]|uniref:BTB domain-containing protein n=1 Tax=Nymphaea colorata TaxID=210225 RepID=A0A5K1DS98_9MAGN|nr:BTB/POZ domain-containing protein At5g41330 [Nymphaea colorata]XP_031485687.1 BTB/POZ domain-containing protein At5g41330 [Nymphaea colorata]XP_031485688.1 BTB/POZ domain-containing protein At5g41330 [Nymphaea colorata]